MALLNPPPATVLEPPPAPTNTPLDQPANFLVVDREGDGVNLEEVTIAPVTITP